MSNKSYLRWIIIATSFVIVSLILWNTYSFFQYFKAEERSKMQTWTAAYNEFSETLYDTENNSEVIQRIIIDTTISTPMILVDTKDNILQIRNIDTLNKRNAKLYLNNLKSRFERTNTPLNLQTVDEKIGKLYYGNSPLLTKLKYYPLALVLIIILFSAVVFFFYRSSKVATQNKLWSGMAKETAHQIGTPLSSLVGWTELLRSENVNPEYINEIEKDIDRLIIITERFSKIGSVPTLEKSDLIIETIESYEYLKTRFKNMVEFKIETPKPPLYVNLNRQLYSWTIENLIKNAIDAMKGKGGLTVKISQTKDDVFITITDTGKGIEKNKFKKVFEPGYTSKKRGWGLGLSLAKRIIENYHNGKIRVLHSQIDKGTTFQIVLKTITGLPE